MDNAEIDRCAAVARLFGVRKLILFGSALESPETARDVDLACEGLDGWELYRFGAKLEEELGSPVDVIALKPNDRFSQYVAQRGRILYEAQ